MGKDLNLTRTEEKYGKLMKAVDEHLDTVKIFDNYSLVKESIKRLKGTIDELNGKQDKSREA